jgi:hypothetical protein
MQGPLILLNLIIKTVSGDAECFSSLLSLHPSLIHAISCSQTPSACALLSEWQGFASDSVPRMLNVDDDQQMWGNATARVGHPVTNSHKWRIGHGNKATCQTKEWSNFELNFIYFFHLSQFVSLFASNGTCNWVLKIYMLWKKTCSSSVL